MKLFYSCENFVKNETDVNVLKTFDESTEFLQKERRYQVKLPVKFEHEELGDNYTKSKQRLKSLLNTFNKGDSDLLFEYDRIIKEQRNLQIIEEVKNDENSICENNIHENNIHYLPHRAVIRNDKESTKVRMVFDASCKSRLNGFFKRYFLFRPFVEFSFV